MLKNNHIAQRGVTLVELLVAISIFGVLLIGAMSLVTGLLSASKRVTQIDMLAGIKHDISRDLTDEIHWAKSIAVSPAYDELTVTRQDDSVIHYRVTAGQLTKELTPLHSAEVEITSFSVRNYNPAGLPSIDIRADLRQKKFVSVSSTFHVVVTQRTLTYAI
jgi:prepilin-type N-terminal cleavage/methylation domain-containing protein